jgi:AhpD family alkylhydroperoxidase
MSTTANAFIVHTLDSAPAASKPHLEATAKAWGFVPTLHATLAESPIALEGYNALFALVAKSTLTPVEQQVAYMTANVFHECEYCTAGHTFLSRKAGMDEAAVQALRNGEVITTNPKLEALRAFTLVVLRDRGVVGDAAVQAFLAAGYTKENVLEVVTIIATKVISNYTNHLAHTPLEGFMSDPALRWIAPRHRAAAAA